MDKVDVIIFTASYGNGHNAVSKSIKERILNHNPEARVEIIDFFKVLAPTKQKFMYGSYLKLIKYAKPIFNFYYFAKEKIPFIKWFDTADLTIRKNCYCYLNDRKAKVVISTFPVCSGYVSKYIKKYNDDMRLFTVITDIVATREWIYQNTSFYCIASRKVQGEMLKKKVSLDKLIVTGIPLNSEFYSNSSDDTIELEGVDSNKRVITFLGGGLGLLPTNTSLYEHVSKIDNVQVLIITGKNKDLYDKLSSSLKQENISVIGYSDNIRQIMKRSQLIIGKPGGITLFEAIMSATPFVMYKPSLGQEINNSKFVRKYSIGYIATNEKELIDGINIIMTDEKVRNEILQNLSEISKEANPDLLINKVIEVVGDCSVN